jgi:transcriptional regulator with XRE-family HTH domain
MIFVEENGDDPGRQAEEGAQMITGEQVKAARTLLGWSVKQLAWKAIVSEATVRNFEDGKHRMTDRSIASIQWAPERASVEFTNGGEVGVKLMARRATREPPPNR